MTTQSKIAVESLRSTLMESSIPDLREFARACGIEYQQQWSGLDLVAQARRWAVYQQRTDVVAAIDRSIADAWAYIAKHLCDARTQGSIANAELLGAGWVRSLSLLTERFPSTVVHEAFALAMLNVAQNLGRQTLPQNITNLFRASVVSEAKLFTPIWLRTINRSTPERMQEVFRSCEMMFNPGDYFAGYVMAWRYGADVAVRYAHALSRSLPRGMFRELPLGSDRQMNELEIFVTNSVSSIQIGSLGMLDFKDIFGGLRGPLSAWAEWLAGVVRDNPSSIQSSVQEIINTYEEIEEIWADENPDLIPQVRPSSSPALFEAFA